MLDLLPPSDPRVVVGPGVGQDAAVLDFGDRYLVAKSDPITFATDAIGWYAVQVNANDIACTGATPRWFLATLLLPEGRSDAALVESIFAHIRDACRALDVSLVGGHTEITYGVDRPIVSGTMLGELSPDRLVTAAGAQPGDTLILTKGIAIEATALIARERADTLQGRLPSELLERCRNFLYQPGLSVVRDAQIALNAGRVHALHDPTEGGLATGLRELALASHVGIEMNADTIPILPETAVLCAEFGLDPLGVIASGALLIAAAAEDASAITQALNQAGIVASSIGQVLAAEAGLRLRAGDIIRPLPTFERDELARLFV
jgi:hydrogenase maturation factor